MSNTEARDAHVGVEIDLPTGRRITGRPVRYADAVALILTIDEFQAGAAPRDTLVHLLAEFQRLTGLTDADFADLSLGEVIDVMNRFFYHRRPAATATAPPPGSVPVPSSR